MKNDLDSREEIERMVQLFYEKVKSDGIIGHFFSSVVPVNWEEHLPKMYDFWEGIILGNSGYTGNPIQVHQHLDHQSPLKKEHFDRWLELFFANLNEHFEGPKTELARQRAQSIAMVMQLKINELKK